MLKKKSKTQPDIVIKISQCTYKTSELVLHMEVLPGGWAFI